jgi:hypothetical protein
MAPREQLAEPLLTAEERSSSTNEEGQVVLAESSSAAADLEACPSAGEDSPSPSFSVKGEMWEMFNLGFPLAVSFCKLLHSCGIVWTVQSD